MDPSGDYGFPSTTAFFTTVSFGMVAYLIWRARRPVAVLGVSLVLALGASRRL